MMCGCIQMRRNGEKDKPPLHQEITASEKLSGSHPGICQVFGGGPEANWVTFFWMVMGQAPPCLMNELFCTLNKGVWTAGLSLFRAIQIPTPPIPQPNDQTVHCHLTVGLEGTLSRVLRSLADPRKNTSFWILSFNRTKQQGGWEHATRQQMCNSKNTKKSKVLKMQKHESCV